MRTSSSTVGSSNACFNCSATLNAQISPPAAPPLGSSSERSERHSQVLSQLNKNARCGISVEQASFTTKKLQTLFPVFLCVNEQLDITLSSLLPVVGTMPKQCKTLRAKHQPDGLQSHQLVCHVRRKLRVVLAKVAQPWHMDM